MVKHTQTIRRQQPTNCLSVFDHFVVLALKGLSRLGHCQKINEISKRITKPFIIFTHWTISGQSFHSVTPENNRKLKISLCFQEVWNGEFLQKWFKHKKYILFLFQNKQQSLLFAFHTNLCKLPTICPLFSATMSWLKLLSQMCRSLALGSSWSPLLIFLLPQALSF